MHAMHLIKTAGCAAAGGLALGVALSSARVRRDSFYRGKVVLITGGSRGLGLEMARRLAGEGAKLVLVARSGDDLERAKALLEPWAAEIMTIVCDVSLREQVKAAIAHVSERFGVLDVLINNAGVIQVGPMEAMGEEDFSQAMAVNFWGPLHMILESLPLLQKSEAGRIINIASFGGKIPVPHFLPYVASKYALVGLSNGLRVELKKHGLLVTTVCPGVMRTGSPPNALFKGQHELESAWFTGSASIPGFSVNAAHAARRILDAGARGKAELVFPLHARCAALLAECFPGLRTVILEALDRMLPRVGGTEGTRSRSGWEVQSGFCRSILTALSDRATRRNNETPREAGAIRPTT